jgi:shikimate kinase
MSEVPSPPGQPGQPGPAARDRHVVLVGMPGAGKSSVGRRLARELARPFADADEQLELAAGRVIPQIFRDDGEATFRRLETQTLSELLTRHTPLVIAAGGGAVISDENRVLLGAHSIVVFLRGSAEFLVDRTDPTHRPLLAEDPMAAYERLDRERAHHYEDVADEIVDIEPFHGGDDKPKRLLARHIVERLGLDPDLP